MVLQITTTHLIDRVAQFIRVRNTILINEEFRGFRSLTDMIFEEKAGGKPGAKSIVENICKRHWMIQDWRDCYAYPDVEAGAV